MAKFIDNTNKLETIVRGTTIRGFLSPEGVGNYLGIRYAEIPERFRNSTAVNLQTHNGIIDATAYAPRCPQPRNWGRERRQHLYEGIQPVTSIPMSEFECLNLNIYTPPSAGDRATKLPVVVWIHGGGFIFGEGSSEYGQ
jgi:carboxylesterase type B